MTQLKTFFILLIFSTVAWTELDLFAPALVDMMKHFQVEEETIQLTLSLNFLGFFLASFVCGPFADSFGRKKSFMVSGLIYVISSLMCYLAPSIEWMLIGRFLQGIGVSAYMVVVTLVLIDIYDQKEQLKAQSISNSFVCILMGGAPILGSFLTQKFGWNSNFSVIFWGSLIALCFCFFIKETLPVAKPFSLNGILKDYKAIFKNKRYMSGFLGLSFLITPYWIFIAFYPLLLQQNLDVDLNMYGYYQGAIVVGFGLTSLIYPTLTRYIQEKKLCQIGVYASAVNSLLMLVVGAFLKDHPVIITALSCLGCVFMVFVNNYLFLQSINACEQEKGAASAFFNTGRMLLLGGSNVIMSLCYQDTFFSVALGCFIFVIAGLPFCLWFINSTEKKNKKENDLLNAA